MRQIVLDTETTGLDIANDHRIIEIAGVELINRKLTKNSYQVYVNPERQLVHPLTSMDYLMISYLINPYLKTSIRIF